MKEKLSLLCVALFLLVTSSANAKIVYNGFDIELNSNNEATITNCRLSGDVVVPSRINYNDKVYIVKTLGPRCFQHNVITSIFIPNTVEKICNSCFSGASIKEIEIPQSVKEMQYNCFYGCDLLENVTLPDNITEMGVRFFAGCSNLKEIKIPQNVKSLGETCFAGCSSLTELDIPEGVNYIGEYCFQDCTNIKTIKLPSDLKELNNNLFYGCSKLRTINLPNGIEAIPEYCFYGCTRLEAIDIPQSVKSIGMFCFNKCTSLTSITFPAGIESIGKACLLDCPNLNEIKCYAKNPPKIKVEKEHDDHMLTTDDRLITLYVPKDAVKTYKETLYWNFFKIQPIDETETSINETKKDKECIYIKGKTLIIKNSTSKIIDLYSISGLHIASLKPTNGEVRYSSDNLDKVIIRDGQNSFKVKF